MRFKYTFEYMHTSNDLHESSEYMTNDEHQKSFDVQTAQTMHRRKFDV